MLIRGYVEFCSIMEIHMKNIAWAKMDIEVWVDAFYHESLTLASCSKFTQSISLLHQIIPITLKYKLHFQYINCLLTLTEIYLVFSLINYSYL